jgi:deazaflavin-dependent oxidoreductase (nitroreductase family)
VAESSVSAAGEGEPPLPCEGIYKTLFNAYRKVPKVRWIERTMARRLGFSPMIHCWMKSSGNEPKRPLVLETIGRRTGQVRQAVLPYWEVDGEYVVLGTLGGAPRDPQWVGNLRARPECAAWIRRRRVPLTARIADEAERQHLARAGVWHTWLDNYQYRARRHGREVPFVVLTPS